MEITRAVTINKPAENLYKFWRDFQNLPQIMKYVQAVRVIGPGRSHSTVGGPVGTTLGWDAEITEDRPNELLVWRSVATRGDR